jgi:K+-sensing histidine kinase KdpD
VSKTADLGELTSQERQNLDRQLNFARGLQIEARVLQGDDVAETVVNFARLHGVTQIFVSRPKKGGVRSRLSGSFVERLVNFARDMQVTIVADRSARPGAA